MSLKILRNTDIGSLSGSVGLFGGSFDPVHNAHLQFAIAASEFKKLDRVIFIPTKNNPLKLNATVASEEQRVEMLELALKDYPDFFISRVELDELPSPSYTLNTLKYFKNNGSPHLKLFFLAGGDIVSQFSEWRGINEYGDFLEGIITIPRSSSGDQKEKATGSILNNLIEGNQIASPVDVISSTQIRDECKIHSQALRLVDPAVASYIRSHNLYR